ncbi:MAG: glpE [Thermoleophilia bacterium]|nr:glpE [Thermoleophilia bacterium]
MLFAQFHLPQLGHASYLVSDVDAGIAIVVDPQVDVRGYIEAAADAGVRITHVLDTHSHSDYRSGRETLAAATGATVLVSAHGAAPVGAQVAVAHGDEFEFGSVWVRAAHVPGHAPEQLALLVGTAADRTVPQLVLSGGSLLCGDIGRPDIDESVTPDVAAPAAIARIREVLLTLPDETLVYPTHVAGSLCSAAPDGATSTTIGAERRGNTWLQSDLDLAAALRELPRKPGFWSRLRATNAQAMPVVELAEELEQLEPHAAMDAGARILDAREVELHAAWHPTGTLHLGTSASGPVLAGAALESDVRSIVLADSAEQALRVAHDLQRVGIDAPSGWVPADRAAWESAGAAISTTTLHAASGLASRPDAPSRVLDVRQPGEWARDGVLEGSILLSLTDLPELGSSLPDESLVVACAAGRRAVTAISVLRLLGRTGDEAVAGGVADWARATSPDVSTPA